MNRIERIADKVATTRLAVVHTYKIGDIFYSSWGYDQTNINFYQVTAVTSKAVKIREILSRRVGGSTGSDSMMPVPNSWDPNSREMVKMVSPKGNLKIESYAYAYPWDGKPKEQTAMGYGH